MKNLNNVLNSKKYYSNFSPLVKGMIVDMEEKKKTKNKIMVLICLIILFLAGIALFGIWYYYNNIKQNSQIKSSIYENTLNKFDKIQISYDYGSIMSFSSTYEGNENNLLEIDVKGEQLTELQNILKSCDIENKKYKIEETGHYHGSTFYSGIVIIPAEYKVKFNDGSEMIIDERDYEIQYKNGDNYYLITDGKAISQKIINIVDENLHQEVVKLNTNMISITGLNSGNTLNISNNTTISKILNEFRYAKDSVVSEELYETLIEYEKNDYDNKRRTPRELEYKIDFNNGRIIKIILRNGNVGCISDENNNFIQGIKINSKFIFMIHNIFTDYYKEKNKLFETEELYVQHNNIEEKLAKSERTELLNKLCMIEIDGNKINESISSSTQDYILKINNNRIILNEDNLYIIYANGDSSYIYSLDLADYIKTLSK